ncbi:CvpA family protein, partial [Sphaerochaeta sp. S2]|uniref:CvpA family protein n=1 Tax=Sphaerochaeta sp. S2 TaxID=2798868 RepID=UPI0018E9AA07
MNYLDIAVIIIIIINVGLGWFRGLIRSVANVVSIILGFFAAKFYHDEMSLFLNQKFDLYNKIKEGLATTFSNIELPSVNLDGISKDMISQELSENDYMRIVAEKFLDSDAFQAMVDQKTLSFADGMTTWL